MQTFGSLVSSEYLRNFTRPLPYLVWRGYLHGSICSCTSDIYAKVIKFFLGGDMSCKYYLSVTEVADLFREIL